jgi:DNA-binding transcriptional regulator PaaX
VEITKDGVKEALQYKIEEMEIPRPARWDGKWRVVIFDIADGKKRQRDQFREKLLELDFYPLNESVYVHAFPCFDEVEFIRQIYFVGGEVQYMLVEKMEDDFALKSFYDL